MNKDVLRRRMEKYLLSCNSLIDIYKDSVNDGTPLKTLIAFKDVISHIQNECIIVERKIREIDDNLALAKSICMDSRKT